jgi:hypothetical protein
MEMRSITVLEWTYSPADYFEAPVVVSRNDYQISIQGGKIDAKLTTEEYENNPGMKEIIEGSLESRFESVQLLTHREYSLTYSCRYCLHPDGRKDIFISPPPAKVSIRAFAPDILITGKDGTIYDSRKERLEKQADLADLVAKYGARDIVAKALLRSYASAVKDPENELTHLYEIRDALAKHFGSRSQALSVLLVSNSDWDALGRLANDEPVKQGRHRGRYTGNLRDASEGELKKARNVALTLISAYLHHLEQANRQDFV